MSYEVIEFNNIKYAEIIRNNLRVDKTTFFSSPDSSFQFGLIAHKAGYVEEPHCHPSIKREITDLQQMFVVQFGKVAVDFYDEDGNKIKEVVLCPGDAILLIHGTHSIRVLEDAQCITVKQGPFIGIEYDKRIMEVKK
ncbi:MAG: hypothetical protein N3A01_01245 [Bacteroidales bacterium]|nr:hypothetical protein [Bacteroidales bacterium]